MNATRLKPSIECLVIDAIAGRVDALDGLVRHFDHQFRAYAATMAARGAQDDAVQEAWVAICAGLVRLRDPDQFVPWAFGILRRKCIDTVRARMRRQPVPQTPREASAAPTSITTAVEELSAEHREVVVLFYGSGLDVATIARVVGVPPGTVKSRLFFARRELRRAIEPTSENPDSHV